MVELSTGDLRAVTGYAVACAADVLPLFEAAAPDDRVPAPHSTRHGPSWPAVPGPCSSARRASPQVVDVLRRYPPAPGRGNRVTQLMSALDTLLRDGGT